MLGTIRKWFSAGPIRDLERVVAEVNAQEPEIAALDDAALTRESLALKERARSGASSLDELLPRAFALSREAARRTLGQRPFDVQIMGGVALHRGGVAEMMTGEGKTLTATAPAYLNALAGRGTHLVTVNEYLARRDAAWMGQVYRALGLSVACLVPNAAYLYDPAWRVNKEEEAKLDAERDTTGSFLVQQDFLRPISRREAYLADVTYGTNHEFGFDYLRDNLAYRPEDQVQTARRKPGEGTGHYFAIIDEVDSILIDEARTPLIISAPDAQSSEYYKTFARVATVLAPGEDYVVDEKLRSATITEAGITKVERTIGVSNIYAPEHFRLVHYLEESLRARALFRRDKDYVVKNGEVIIIDEFTGRMLQGRRYNGGLHQAIEAKEGVFVKEESRTYAKISIQNYFRMYEKLSGMTGTAQTSAEEFHKVYHLDVTSVPTHRPPARTDEADAIYKNAEAKWRAVVRDVEARRAKGQPVLLGTTSIEKNEMLSAMLQKEGVPHEVLNAKNNEREGAIIAQAGRPGAVTVATNVAGRGVDIILGGNPPDPAEAEKVKTAGGLHVLGTERHEARRIDNQLRGRAGRQGDPGSSQFFLSLDDDLLRIFGGDRIKGMMERFDLPEDEPIQMGFVSRAVAQAQAKVEGANFDMRKHLLEYDDVLNKQRGAVYRKRDEILMSPQSGELANIVFSAAKSHLEALLATASALDEGDPAAELKARLTDAGIVNAKHPFPDNVTIGEGGVLSLPAEDALTDLLTRRSVEVATNPQAAGAALSVLDSLWMAHLENLEALTESVGLRAYAQKDPLVEYRGESKRLYEDFWANFNGLLFSNIFKLASAGQPRDPSSPAPSPSLPAVAIHKEGKNKVGRNDPCPCGSGKKYKKCHGA